VLAQRAVDGKSNEFTAIPELLDMLSLKGAIVSIDAMGTQKQIAQRIVDKDADYVLALKGNQTSLHEDAALFFADPACAAACAGSAETDAGHCRIEERSCRVAEASWLATRHPGWKGLRPLAAVSARRIDKKSGGESLETRFDVTSLEPDPKAILAVRAHWGIENNLHWTMGDFRRRPLPNQKRRFAVEFRHHPPHRIQYPQSRSNARLPPTKTTPSLHRPSLPLQPFRRLPI
jgi:predicted transposase YbfD/YdcC